MTNGIKGICISCVSVTVSTAKGSALIPYIIASLSAEKGWLWMKRRSNSSG